jgi:hypothetical protein
MALVDGDHVPILGVGFATLLIASLGVIWALNHFADK